jgi:hypothetical protein
VFVCWCKKRNLLTSISSSEGRTQRWHRKYKKSRKYHHQHQQTNKQHHHNHNDTNDFRSHRGSKEHDGNISSTGDPSDPALELTDPENLQGKES